MKLYIPSLGDQMRLTADWTFDLYDENRNATLMEHIGDTRPICITYGDEYTTIPCTLPAGTILKMDRIYIRKGQDNFDSVTFMLVGAKTEAKVVERKATKYMGGPDHGKTFSYNERKPARPVRFWVKLQDANNIEFEPV